VILTGTWHDPLIARRQAEDANDQATTGGAGATATGG
jgi:hypothetical protein